MSFTNHIDGVIVFGCLVGAGIGLFLVVELDASQSPRTGGPIWQVPRSDEFGHRRLCGTSRGFRGPPWTISMPRGPANGSVTGESSSLALSASSQAPCS